MHKLNFKLVKKRYKQHIRGERVLNKTDIPGSWSPNTYIAVYPNVLRQNNNMACDGIKLFANVHDNVYIKCF